MGVARLVLVCQLFFFFFAILFVFILVVYKDLQELTIVGFVCRSDVFLHLLNLWSGRSFVKNLNLFSSDCLCQLFDCMHIAIYIVCASYLIVCHRCCEDESWDQLLWLWSGMFLFLPLLLVVQQIFRICIIQIVCADVRFVCRIGTFLILFNLWCGK